MKTLKETIKELSAEQTMLKGQRKTVHLKGERIVPAREAESKVRWNRWELRHLFIAYTIARGKEPQYPTKAEYSQSKIDKMVEKYVNIASVVPSG